MMVTPMRSIATICVHDLPIWTAGCMNAKSYLYNKSL